MAASGEAIFRAIADFSRLRREAKGAAQDLKTTRAAARDADTALGDLETTSNSTAGGLDKVDKSAKNADRSLTGLGKSSRGVKVLATALGLLEAGGALIGPAVGAVTALAAGLVSVVGAAAPAVGGLAAVGAMGGALAQGMIVSKVAVSGVDGALKALQARSKDTRDEFDKANPSVQRFATFLDGQVLPALHRVRDAIQERALPKFETAIRALLPLAPMLSDKLRTTADTIGNLAIQGARMVSSGPWTRDFATILDSNNRMIAVGGNAALTYADALRHLWVTALPLAERLTSLTLKGAENARAFLDAKRSSGELTAFFQKSGDVIEQLMRILGNLFVSIFNIGKAAAPAGKILLDTFEAATRKFREFTGSVEGQNKMRQFFLDMVPVVVELSRLVVDLAKAFVRIAQDDSLGPLITQIRTQLLPAIERFIAVMSDSIGPLLVSFLTNITNIMTQLGGGALTGFLFTLNAIAAALAWILSIPGLGEFVGFILMLGGAGYALGLVGGAITGIAGALTKLGPALQLVMGLLRALAAAALAHPIIAAVTAIALIALLIITNWDTVKQWLAAFWSWLTSAAQVAWDFLAMLFSNFTLIGLIISHWDQIKAATSAAWEAIKLTVATAWALIQAGVSAAGSAIQGAVSSAWNAVQSATSTAWSAVQSAISSAWSAIQGAVSSAASAVQGAISSGWSAVNSATSSAWGTIRSTVASGASTVQSAVSTAWNAVQSATSSSWSAIQNAVANGANAVRNAVSSIPGVLSGIGNAFWSLGSTISGAWNSINSVVHSAANYIIGVVNSILNAIARAKSAAASVGNAVRSVVPGYASGGMVGGSPAAGDTQIIRATAGEWVVPADVTKRFLPFLKAITFGSARSAAQMIDPVQTRLLQDRLAGLPQLSQLGGLREMLAGARAGGGQTVTNTDSSSRTVNVVNNIYNPISEPASSSVADRLRTLSLMGAFG